MSADVKFVNLNPFYARYSTLLTIIGITVVTGIVHIITLPTGQNSSGTLLLIIATILLCLGIRSVFRYLQRQTPIFIAYAMPDDDPNSKRRAVRDLILEVFDTRNATIIAILYATIISVGGVITLDLSSSPNTMFMQSVYFVSFIFPVNFVTGVAAYGIATLIRKLFHMGSWITLTFWERDNPATRYILDLASRVSLIASIYVSLSMTSILFLELNLNILAIFYSLFSALICLTIYLAPTLPLRTRFDVIKEEALVDIDEKIESMAQVMFEVSQKESINDEEWNSLNVRKDQIMRIEAWPYDIKSLLLIGLIILISLLPAILGILFSIT